MLYYYDGFTGKLNLFLLHFCVQKYYHKYNADKARYDKEMKEYTSMVKQGSVDTDDTVKVEPMT